MSIVNCTMIWPYLVHLHTSGNMALQRFDWHLQGYLLQMPSARAALRLPSATVPLTAASQQHTAPTQAPQEQQTLAEGPGVKGTPERAPTAMKGTKGMPSGQPQPVDMEKLLTVPAGVQEWAACSSDAHALLLKVC